MKTIERQQKELCEVLSGICVEQQEQNFQMLKYYNAPITMVWELTGKCSSNCIYCSGGFPKKTEDLTYEEKQKLVEEIIDMKVFMINLSGGDPMLCEELEELVEKFTDAQIQVMICTPGLYEDESLICRLCQNPLVAFNISLDSGIKEINDMQRGKGAFDAAVRLLEQIHKYSKGNNFVSVETVVTKKSMEHMESVLEILKEYMVHEWRIQPVVPMNRATYDKKLNLTFEEIELVKKKVEKLQKIRKKADRGNLLGIRFIDQAKTVIAGTQRKANWGGIISPEGDLMVNGYIPFKFGNIREYGSLKEAWKKGFRTAWSARELQYALKDVKNVEDLGKVYSSYGYKKKNIKLENRRDV